MSTQLNSDLNSIHVSEKKDKKPPLRRRRPKSKKRQIMHAIPSVKYDMEEPQYPRSIPEEEGPLNLQDIVRKYPVGLRKPSPQPRVEY